MGVPKFFRWVAERCPSVITPHRDFPPPVDNLYLDMNGIIHNCTHPNDVDTTQRSATEKAMMEAMFAYLEKLFNAIQPRKYFLLAVDGVAPRAKMNQQRQRRYRSGYDMMVARQEALERGEEIPDEKDVFDSNCITPGTDFMVRVSEQFQYFITMKIATDPAWQNCQVIYSGHDHPGEGEHKIVDFIRRRKMQPGYSENETHCMYGLDADLVMLALATHEPHFVLLREVVTFGAGQESRRVREQREEDESYGIIADKSYQKVDEFVLFHVNVLRDYMDLDIRDKLGESLPANYDLERVVDDFVLMCFFIGNDFLPSIPTLSIHDGSLTDMLDLYCRRVLKEGNFLTDKGQVNWHIVEPWLHGLGDMEFATIKTREQQEEEYQRKMTRRDPSHEATLLSTASVESLREYKDRFYRDKHGFENGWEPQGKELAKLKLHYIEGILWVMGYYYQGPPSWKWFFPHHYAPMASDLVDLPNIAARVRFDPGEPFLPHQQLLAVLPPMSYRSIPRAYWPLLRGKTSPLAKYFPDNLKIDREGARAPWEGIVLIPFIDERVLLESYKSVQNKVTPEDQKHNRLGPPLRFFFDPKMEPCEVPNIIFGPLRGVRVRREAFEFPPLTTFLPKLCPGVAIGKKQLEGFSALRSKWSFIDLKRETGVVTIFGMPTRKESLILELKDTCDYVSALEGKGLVGQEVLVGFPHYRRARVSSIVDKNRSIQADIAQDGTFRGTLAKELNRDESMNFTRECETHKRYMKEKLGIAVDKIQVLVHVNLFTNMQVTRKGRIIRNFSKDEVCYPIHLLSRLQDVEMLEDSRYVERDRVDYEMDFGTKVIFIGPEPKSKKPSMRVYGSTGFVLDSNSQDKNMYTVTLRVYQESLPLPPSLLSFASPRNWVPLHEVSDELRIGNLALRLLIGSLRTTPQYGSRELGLGLVFARNHLARIGYVKLVARQTNGWMPYVEDVFSRVAQLGEQTAHYLDSAVKGNSVGRTGRAVQYTTWLSREAVELVRRYVQEFGPLVKRLETGNVAPQALEPPQFMTGDWETREVDDVLGEIESFITACGIRDVPLLGASDDVFTREHVQELEDELDRRCPREVQMKTLQPVAKWHLYFPITRSKNGHLVQLPLPQEQTFRLGARVVNCCATGCVPFGAVGTIVRLLATSRDAEVVYDEPFTGGSYFDGRLRQSRGCLSKLSSLLVLSRPGDDGGEETKTGATALSHGTTPLSILKPPPTLRSQEQRQKVLSPATESGPVIPRPRSALEDVSRTSTPGVTMTSLPAALTMCGGADGIQVVDLIGKLNAAPEHGGAVLGVMTSSMTEGQGGSCPSSLAAAPMNTTASPICFIPNLTDSRNSNNNISGDSQNINPATVASSALVSGVVAHKSSDANCGKSSSVTSGICSVPRPRSSSGGGDYVSRSPGNNNGRPNAATTIPQDILDGNLTIHRENVVPVFRNLLRKRLREELSKLLEE